MLLILLIILYPFDFIDIFSLKSKLLATRPSPAALLKRGQSKILMGSLWS